MYETIESTASDIRNMTIRGAGRIARAGASAMGFFAEMYHGANLTEFVQDISKAKDILLASRPTAVSLWNGVHASMRGLSDASTIDEARELVITNSAAFVEMSQKAVDMIAFIGAKRICNGDLVMTHCNSSAVVATLRKAHEQGKEFRVFATESRPWRQGIITVNELADSGIDTTLIIDSAVRSVMKKADKVFVGADTITSHGALVNKIGTSQLASAAHEARVQFYVCSETYKFSPMTLFGDMVTIEERDIGEIVSKGEIRDAVKVFNPVFDSTPATYIDAIITELGMISPGSVYDIMVRQLGESVLKE